MNDLLTEYINELKEADNEGANQMGEVIADLLDKAQLYKVAIDYLRQMVEHPNSYMLRSDVREWLALLDAEAE